MLARDPEAVAICLVQSKFAALARERAREFGDRVRFLEGDITSPINFSPAGISEIYHLAAIYDLSVTRDAGVRVNVEGTRRVLDFAERCTSLRRLHYISTCYVSAATKVFREDDLDVGQALQQFLRRQVSRRSRSQKTYTIPSTFRPAVVVGDSRTGATQKYDGRTTSCIGFCVSQIAIAGGRPHDAISSTSCRATSSSTLDFLRSWKRELLPARRPESMTVDEIIKTFASATQRKIVRIPLPMLIARLGAPMLRIPRAAVNYFTQPTTYDTTNAQRDLGSISVPRFSDYAPRLVEFFRAHPEISAMGMA